MRRVVVSIILALFLHGCIGAGYNFGCKGREGTTQWCRYHGP